jgi:putative membrane protein
MWGDGSDSGWQMMDGGGGAFMWVVMALVLLTFVAASVAIVLAVRRPSRNDTPALPTGNSATRALDERFARGEIDEDEYWRRRSVLLTP